jgi:histidinol phosphatase-like PHP family hydrolase
MYTDIFGNKRYKVNLHTHTTLSDGHRTPEEVAQIYAEQGYDAVAFTDHWYCGKEQTLSGFITETLQAQLHAVAEKSAEGTVVQVTQPNFRQESCQYKQYYTGTGDNSKAAVPGAFH